RTCRTSSNTRGSWRPASSSSSPSWRSTTWATTCATGWTRAPSPVADSPQRRRQVLHQEPVHRRREKQGVVADIRQLHIERARIQRVGRREDHGVEGGGDGNDVKLLGNVIGGVQAA